MLPSRTGYESLSRSPAGHRAGGDLRPGIALVSALALLTLAAALLAAACLSARALERHARSTSASAQADALARRFLAELVAAWDGPEDALAVGASSDRALTTRDATPLVTARARVTRLGARLYAIVVDVRVGTGPSQLANRRYRLLLERFAPSDSVPLHAPIQAIYRWSLADIY